VIDRLIDVERESNVIARETVQRLRFYRKRSISDVPSVDIVGIYPTYDQVSKTIYESQKCIMYTRA